MFFEEFAVGQVYETNSHLLTAEEVARFATAYDPQPIHLDTEGAPLTPFGGVVASGFQVMAIGWRLWVETAITEHGRAGISLTDARWHQPVYPETKVHAKVTIEDTRVTGHGYGLITMGFEVYAGEVDVVLTFRTTGILARLAEWTS